MATDTATPLLESPLPREILFDLYSNMLRARSQAKRLRNSSSASEAILAGALANTDVSDVIVSAGKNPVLDALTATSTASTNGAERPASRVIAVGPDAAAGIASGLSLALKNTSSAAITVVFLPGKVARGFAWEDATAFAAANRLPIIFVCDGIVSRPPRKHGGHDMSHWPLPTIAVDGRDVIAVYRVTKEAISNARRGHGPTLVDCVDFVVPGRRGKDQRDPLTSFRGYLKRHDAWSEDAARELEDGLRMEVAVRGS